MGHDLSEPDQLRALHNDPELWALMELHEAARTPAARQAALEAFVKAADALYPDWRRTMGEAEDDGRIPRAMAIHCVKRIRERIARGELDEFEKFEAKGAEVKFVVSFDEAMASSNLPAAAFRMLMALWELMRLAQLDPEEMAEIERQAHRKFSDKGRLESIKNRVAKKEAWREIATRLEDPTVPLNEVAIAMLNLWPSEKKDLYPGPDRITRFVSDLRVMRGQRRRTQRERPRRG